jgi:hypothetical protein
MKLPQRSADLKLSRKLEAHLLKRWYVARLLATGACETEVEVTCLPGREFECVTLHSEN